MSERRTGSHLRLTCSSRLGRVLRRLAAVDAQSFGAGPDREVGGRFSPGCARGAVPQCFKGSMGKPGGVARMSEVALTRRSLIERLGVIGGIGLLMAGMEAFGYGIASAR